jgi:hypothetical protein
VDARRPLARTCYRREVRRWVARCFVASFGFVACGSEEPSEWERAAWPAPLEDGLVIDWRVQDAWGVERFTITREGAARFEANVTRGNHSVRVARDLSPTDLETLRDDLVAAGCCALGSQSIGPPEGRLRVRLPNASCDITLPVEAWDEPGPKSCERALRRLHGRPRFRE